MKYHLLKAQLLLSILFFSSFSLSLEASELRDVTCVPFETAPEVSEEDSVAAELAIAAFQMRQAACKNPDGSFKNSKVQFQAEEETEELDCVSMAEQAYMVSVRNNCEVNRAGLMGCLTSGWDQRDVFDMFDRLQEIDQAVPNGENSDPFANKLGMKLDEHFACPGKTEPASAILTAIGCNVISSVSAMSPVGSITSDLVINHLIPEDARPAASQCIDEENSCLTQVLWGAIQNVFTNIQGIYELGKMAGNAVVAGAQATGRGIKRAWNWMWGNDEVEDASADQLAAAAQIPNNIGTMEAAQEEREGWMKRFINGLLESAGEGMRDQFSCSKWEGGVSGAFGTFAGMANRLGSEAGMSSARCVEAAPSWECASSKQKVQMLCGIAGFVGGEIVTTLLTGGTVRAASAAGAVVSRAAANGSRIARATMAVGRGVSGGISRSVVGVGGIGVSLVGTAATKARALGGMALKFGDKIIPMNQRMQLMYMSALAGKATPHLSKGAQALMSGVKTALTPARKYLDLLDQAYMVGRYGTKGAAAMRNLSHAGKADEMAEAIKEGMVSKNLNRKELYPNEGDFRNLAQGQEVFERLQTAQKNLQDAQTAFLESVKKARRGSNGADADALMKEADEAFLAYQRAKNALAPADEAYTEVLTQYQQQLAREKFLAAEAAENARKAQEQAQRLAREQAQRQSTPVTTTALTTTDSASRQVATTGARTGTTVATTSSTKARVALSQSARRAGQTRRPHAIGDGIHIDPSDLGRGNIPYSTAEKARVLDDISNVTSITDKRLYIYRDGAETWADNVFNPRVEGDKLVGNLNKVDGELVEIPIESISLVDVRGSYTLANGTKEAFVSPFSLSRSSDPKFTNFAERAAVNHTTRSSAEVRTMLDEMTNMTHAERARVASVTNFKLGQGVMPSEMEFLAAIKNNRGYSTKAGLPNLEKIREIYATENVTDALRLIDDLYPGSSTPTELIKNNLRMMVRRMGTIREVRQATAQAALTSGAGTGLLTAGAGADDAGRALALTQQTGSRALLTTGDDAVGTALAIRAADDAIVPAPILLSGSDGFPPINPFRAAGRFSRAGRMTAAFGAAKMVALSTAEESPVVHELDPVVIIASRSTHPSYSMTASYIAGPPKKCDVYIRKRVDGELEDDPMETQRLESDKITVKWFKAAGEDSANEICSGAMSCQFPENVEEVHVYAYKDGTKFQNIACSAPEETFDPTRDLAGTRDRDEGDDDSDGIDRAEQFYQQQRNPPPSLFQPIRIPSRSTNYLHGGYY